MAAGVDVLEKTWIQTVEQSQYRKHEVIQNREVGVRFELTLI